MQKYLILILTMVVLLTSCQKYEVQYGTETATTTVVQDGVFEIAYSTEEGVFLITTGMDRTKMLVSFANKLYPEAGRVALSPKRDKVAYVDPDNGVPIIIDTSGNVLAELTQYTNTKDLGWYNGDETLYILSNNQVHFYGQALDLPSPLFVTSSANNNYRVTTIDINENLDVVYGVVYYKSVGAYRDWYYGWGINYKSPSLNDKYNTIKSVSHHYIQNIGADSKRYYHTLRFSDSEYTNGVEEITQGIVSGAPSSLRFTNDYLLRKNGFELRVGKDGSLFKKAIDNNRNYDARLWDIDVDYQKPLYLDWTIEF